MTLPPSCISASQQNTRIGNERGESVIHSALKTYGCSFLTLAWLLSMERKLGGGDWLLGGVLLYGDGDGDGMVMGLSGLVCVATRARTGGFERWECGVGLFLRDYVMRGDRWGL